MFSVSRVAVLAVATLAGLTSAQGTLPSCATECVTEFTSGSQIGGCSSINIVCICSNANFLSNIACCLVGKCDEADQEAATAYAKSFCALSGVTNLPNAVSCASTASTAAATGTSGSSTVAQSVTSVTSSSSSASSVSSVGSSTSSAGSSTSAGGSSTTSAASSESSAISVTSHSSSSTSSSAGTSATKNAGPQNMAGLGAGVLGGLAAAVALL